MVELVKVDKKMLSEIRRASNTPAKYNLQRLIEEFCCSEEKVAELKWNEGHYKNASSAQAAIGRAIKSSHAAIEARVINKRLFLIKAGAFDE